MQALDKKRWTMVTYEDLVRDTRSVVGKVFNFMDIDNPDMEGIPVQLDTSFLDGWKKALSKKEQKSVKSITALRSFELEELSKYFGVNLMPA